MDEGLDRDQGLTGAGPVDPGAHGPGSIASAGPVPRSARRRLDDPGRPGAARGWRRRSIDARGRPCSCWRRHWLAADRLRRLAGRPVHLGVLAPRPLHRRHRHGAVPPELRGAAHRRRSTGPSRSGRSSSRRRSPSPTSSWPSRSPTSWPGRQAADAGAARRLDPAAAVVRLPRQGLRLAADPEPGRGSLNWVLAPFGLEGPGYGDVAVWLVMSYLWLPYMIIPIFAGLERHPELDPRGVGRPRRRAGDTFRRVILPMVFPAVVAGSIFTFSLTLGDYITPTLVSSTQFIGNVIYSNVGVAGNQPLAAAVRVRAGHRHDHLSAGRAPPGRVRGPVMGRRGRRAGCCGSRRHHARVHLHPDRRHRPVLVQRGQLVQLADHRADPRLVVKAFSDEGSARP